MSDSSPSPTKKLYAPRYWPTWLGFGLIWLIVRLPLGWVLAISQALGRLLYKVAKRRRRIAEINIELCFPELSKTAQEKLVRDHFGAMVMGMFEMGMAWWLPTKRIQKILTIKGVENLEAALAQGKGVLLLSAHFTCLELSGRFFSSSLKHSWSGMYRPHENPVVEYLFQKDRSQFFNQLIARDDIRTFLRCLKKNEPIWYAPDQNFCKRGMVMAPFFDVPAPSNPATSRLAKISKAAIVPFEYRRLPDTQGYLMEFHPMLEEFPAEDDTENTALVNKVFEEMVRRAPEQYFWMHRRFKMKFDPKPDVYQQRGM